MPAISGIVQNLRRLLGGAAGAPSTLLAGQLFSNESENVLYIGTGNNGSGVSTAQMKVGGAGAFADLASTQTIGGAKTFSTIPQHPAAAAFDASTNSANTAFVATAVQAVSVPSVAALRALPYAVLAAATPAFAIKVQGYYAGGNGLGGGDFVWNASSTAADDGGTVINPTGNAGAGRFLRLIPLGFVALEMFGVDFTGVNDCATAVQNAVNAATACAYELRVSPGEIKLTAPITISAPLRMIGVRPQVVAATSASGAAAHGTGTWFHIAHAGKGFAFSSPTTGQLVYGSMVHQIGTFRDQPVPGTGAYSPGNFDFDWSFSWHTCDIDVVCLNATNGIDFNNAGQSRVRSFLGQPLGIGIRALNNYDVIVIDRVHLWPWWTFNAQVAAYMTYASIGIQVGRCDNLVGKTIFAYGYYIAFDVVQYAGDGTGYNPAGTFYNGQIACLDTDACAYGIRVESGANGAQFNVSDFIAFGPSQATYPGLQGSGAGIFANNVLLAIGRMHFSTQGYGGVRVEGSNGLVRITAALCETWGAAVAEPGLQCNGAGSKILVVSADIGANGASPNGTPLFGTGASDGARVTVPATMGAALDTSSTLLTIASGATLQLLAASSGMVNLTASVGDGSSALFLFGGGAVNMLGQSGAIFVASNAPAAGKIGVYYDANASRYTIANNFGSQAALYGTFLKNRPSN